MDALAIVGVAFWCLIVAALAYDEARREQPPTDDTEARAAFEQRQARELAGRDV